MSIVLTEEKANVLQLYYNMKEYNKAHPIRLTDETWEKFSALKEDGVSWEVFIKELTIKLTYESNNSDTRRLS